MDIIRSHDCKTQPWKNGLGVTREICSETQSADQGGGWLWRLSLARVDQDGPFSRFDGFDRILTVVRGEGMWLRASGLELDAHPFTPVRFSGDLDVSGQCRSTPIENFNLIFDPRYISANVQITNATTLASNRGGISILHVLKGRITHTTFGSVNAGDTCVMKAGRPELQASDDLQCALVSLSRPAA